MSGLEEQIKWYVVVTRSHFERKSYELLKLNKIEAFFPTQKQIRVWSDRKKEVEVPLFNGYLFVRIRESQRYEVLNTLGIVCFVRFNGKDAEIPQAQIDAIRIALTHPKLITVNEVLLEVGQQVFISSGPFKGYYAHLVRISGKDKLLVSIDAIGKGILVEIGRTKVEEL